MLQFLKQGDNAVIVGCATGIGRAAALKWAKLGVNLALFDLNKDALGKLAAEAGEYGVKVKSLAGDITSKQDLYQFKKLVDEHYGGKVDLLFLNAATNMPTNFKDAGKVRRLIEINFLGIVNCVSALIDQDTKDLPRRIIITGSKQGITNPPGNPGYNASKAAVKSYVEGLSYSLKDEKNVDVHMLIPGWTFTPLAGDDGSRPKPAAAATPEEVVDQLEQGVSAGNFYILCSDNEVTVEMDKIRTLWNTEDILKQRPPLSRWRDEYKSEFANFVAEHQGSSAK